MNESPSSRPTTQGCPTLETLRAFAHGQLPDGQILDVAAHLYLRGCSRCGELLLTFPETTASALEPPPAAGADEAPTDEVVSRRTVDAKDGRAIATEHQPLRLGRYAIRHQVGKGGFGTVYAAHDEELDRLVAVKVPFAHRLSPGEQQQAAAEARLHASLDHPNIVPIYDVGRTPEIPCYFVSKLIAGRDLAARIKEGRPDHREAAEVLLFVAGALAHMHGRGLVHRDVKPRNILLDEAGIPYLADFGLATQPVRPGQASADEHVLAGTLAYMSPEQARGESRRVDHRTDLYALGVVLYEMLTGKKPFRGGVVALRHQILHDEPASLHALDPQVPLDLEAICRKAMAKNIDRRYQDAGELGEDLRRFLADETPRYARPVSLGDRARSWLRRHRALTAAAAVAALAVLVAVGMALRPPAVVPVVVAAVEKTVPTLVKTVPAGASVSCFPLDPETGFVRPDKVVRGKAGEVLDLPPGRHLIVAVLNGGTKEVRFHEVYRLVPGSSGGIPGPFTQERSTWSDGVCHLPDIKIPPADVVRDMCFVEGAEEFVMGSKDLRVGDLELAPPHRRRVPSFFLDTTEVTVQAFNAFMKVGPDQPSIPAKGDPTDPATNVRWDQAVGWAELLGKRLPDEAEYEFAATARGTSRFPWGNEVPKELQEKRWLFGRVGQPEYDRLRLPGQKRVVCGLYSNVAEWTSSWAAGYPGRDVVEPDRKLRVIRGAPNAIIDGKPAFAELFGPRERYCMVVPENRPGLGFRCARSAKPRLAAEVFVTVLGQ